MPNTDEPSGHVPAQSVRIDSQTTLSLALVMALVGALVVGAVQYGRQSARLDSMETQLEKVTEKLDALTAEIAKLNAAQSGR
jgi:cell division protein FtsB